MSSINSSIIKDIVLEDAHLNFTIHPYVYKTIDVLQSSNLFLYFRTYRITQYVNPRDAVIVGGTIHSGAWMLGLSDYLKTALYMKCAIDLYAKYEQIYESCEALSDALKFKYPVYHVVEWEFQNTKGSPSIVIWWRTTAKSYREQTIKVIKCTLIVLSQIFKLGLFLRDLTLLTQNDPTIEFYACTELADDLNNHCVDLEKNLGLLFEQLKSRESIGNRLLNKAGFETGIAGMIDNLVKENPRFFAEVREQVKFAGEDFRSISEKGSLDFSIGAERPNKIKKCRFVPYLGQQKVEVHFQQAIK